MKKILLLLGITIVSIFGCSRQEKSIYPNFEGENLTEIEKNKEWKVLTKEVGDLNKDGINDTALILESRDSILEERRGYGYKKNIGRIILVLLDDHGEQKVISQNNKFIARANEGGMAPHIEPKLNIEDNLLEISTEYTRSSQSYYFQFKKNQMEIVKSISNGVSGGMLEYQEVNFSKNEIIIEKGEISDKELQKEKMELKKKPKNLSDFKAMYEWKISKYVSL